MVHGCTSRRCTAFRAPTIEALIEALDPEVRAAIDDVDRTLIALALQQSPWDRLRSASRMAQTLARIRDAIASRGATSAPLLELLGFETMFACRRGAFQRGRNCRRL